MRKTNIVLIKMEVVIMKKAVLNDAMMDMVSGGDEGFIRIYIPEGMPVPKHIDVCVGPKPDPSTMIPVDLSKFEYVYR